MALQPWLKHFQQCLIASIVQLILVRKVIFPFLIASCNLTLLFHVLSPGAKETRCLRLPSNLSLIQQHAQQTTGLRKGHMCDDGITSPCKCCHLPVFHSLQMSRLPVAFLKAKICPLFSISLHSSQFRIVLGGHEIIELNYKETDFGWTSGNISEELRAIQQWNRMAEVDCELLCWRWSFFRTGKLQQQMSALGRLGQRRGTLRSLPILILYDSVIVVTFFLTVWPTWPLICPTKNILCRCN